MANDKLKEMASVMFAASEGKVIQCRLRGDFACPSSQWRDAGLVEWNWADFEYRVKPEPREWWAVINVMEKPVAFACSKEDADFCSKSWNGSTVVRVREVIED